MWLKYGRDDVRENSAVEDLEISPGDSRGVAPFIDGPGDQHSFGINNPSTPQQPLPTLPLLSHGFDVNLGFLLVLSLNQRPVDLI